MSIEELREWAAVEVMGWKSDGQIQDHYYNDGWVTGFDSESWKPDKDLNQLSQVVKKWCGDIKTRKTWDDLAIAVNRAILDDCGVCSSGQVIHACFTNPELVLLALYEVVKK
jgi:hypothetical protein